MERLRKLRESKNITQKEMSDFLGVDRTTYVKYETGSSEPNFLTLAKLADYFNVTTDYLLGREDVKKTPPSDDEGIGGDYMLNIKAARTAKKLTQQQVSEHLGITRGAYSNIESGKRETDYSTLNALADLFGVSVDYLLGKNAEKKAPSPDGEGAGLALQGRPELAALVDRLSKLDDDQLRSAKDYLDFILSRDFLGDSDSP